MSCSQSRFTSVESKLEEVENQQRQAMPLDTASTIVAGARLGASAKIDLGLGWGQPRGARRAIKTNEKMIADDAAHTQESGSRSSYAPESC